MSRPADVAAGRRRPSTHLPERPVVGPAVGLGPQAVEDLQLPPPAVEAFTEAGNGCPARRAPPRSSRRRRRPRSRPPLISSAVVTSFAKLPGMRKVTGRDERAEADALGLAREAGERRSRRRSSAAGFAREARVVVGAEEGLEAGGLGRLRDRQLLVVATAPAGARSSARSACAPPLAPVRDSIAVDTIVHADYNASRHANYRRQPRSRPTSARRRDIILTSAPRSASFAASAVSRLVQGRREHEPHARAVAAQAPRRAVHGPARGDARRLPLERDRDHRPDGGARAWSSASACPTTAASSWSPSDAAGDARPRGRAAQRPARDASCAASRALSSTAWPAPWPTSAGHRAAARSASVESTTTAHTAADPATRARATDPAEGTSP